MTKIPYTYEILSVSGRSMEVRYENPDHGVMHVGVRIPYEGEDLEAVIDQFSPALLWAEQSRPVQEVTVGMTGTGETVVSVDPEDFTPEELLEMWRESATISQFQAHYTLKVWGLYDQVVVLVEAMGDPLELAFQRASEWRRNSPAILSLFSNLTMPTGNAPTPEDVDRFFIEAASFTV
jgi:hypothetical protein